jgi:nicotinic acid mononucleotide adenylyltransferase
MRVAVFGLSGNPPTFTGGHAGVVKAVASLVDEVSGVAAKKEVRCDSHQTLLRLQVWVLPVYRHVYSSKQDLAPFQHRLRLCQLGLCDVAANVRVLDTERTVYESVLQVMSPAKLHVVHVCVWTCSAKLWTRICSGCRHPARLSASAA